VRLGRTPAATFAFGTTEDDRRLVEADDRLRRIKAPRVQPQNVLHAYDELAIDVGHAPFFGHGLSSWVARTIGSRDAGQPDRRRATARRSARPSRDDVDEHDATRSYQTALMQRLLSANSSTATRQKFGNKPPTTG